MRIEKIPSEFDGLKLEVAIATPVETPKGIIQFSHGMAEHKERYFDFMNYLNSHGYVCVIHDHRGHGESVEMEDDYGFFYTENEQAIIDDLYTVTKFIKNEYPCIPLYLFSHSMGTLVARGFLKRYDSEIEKIVL
ncbi:MAG: alpha/beta hydrolase, partial [Blautia sp.]